MPDDGYASGARAAPLAPETPAAETLANACQAGIVAEIANHDLYDTTLLPSVVACRDITRVMQRLRHASEDNHLPAFQRCVDRG